MGIARELGNYKGTHDRALIKCGGPLDSVRASSLSVSWLFDPHEKSPAQFYRDTHQIVKETWRGYLKIRETDRQTGGKFMLFPAFYRSIFDFRFSIFVFF